MIESVRDLVLLTNRAADLDPLGEEGSRLTSPGCSESEIEKIRKYLPGIPENYLSVISRVSLQERSLLFYNLWPGPVRRALADSLIEVNHGIAVPCDAPPRIHYGNGEATEAYRRGLYEVASLEASPIVIGRKGASCEEGVVFMTSHDAPDVPPRRLCRDFETFLLLVGNMFEIRQRLGDSHEAVSQFLSILPKFALEPEEIAFWEQLAGDLAPLEEVEKPPFPRLASGWVDALRARIRLWRSR